MTVHGGKLRTKPIARKGTQRAKYAGQARRRGAHSARVPRSPRPMETPRCSP